MIKTIIFDLGKVIVPFDFKRGYDRMAPLCSYPAEQIPERLRTCDLVTRFETGKVEPEVFVRELSSILELNASYDEFCDIWSAIFLPDTLIPESLLVALKQRYRLLLLSNTNAIHFGMIEKNYPLLRHMDHFVLSYRVGAMKPQPEIYQEAIRHAQCAPEECFFTDDIPDYVAGARAQGIDAEQFQGLEKLEADLRRREIKW
jgi:FMN phosphatase YigB (HAD superfamily)